MQKKKKIVPIYPLNSDDVFSNEHYKVTQFFFFEIVKALITSDDLEVNDVSMMTMVIRLIVRTLKKIFVFKIHLNNCFFF